MAEAKTETTVNAITSNVQVLAIADDEKCSISEKPEEISKRKRFRIRAKSHLSMLLMGIRTPGEVHKTFDEWQFFSVSSIKEDKQPRRYKFHCSHNRNFPASGIYQAATYNAHLVMDEVRKRLKDENWISEYVVETPLRTKPNGVSALHLDGYMQVVVADALNAADNKIMKFVLQLHLEHMKKN